MKSLSLLSLLKYIGIAVVIAILGYIVWDIKSTYKEVDELTLTVQTQKDSIQALQDDVKLQKELNVSLEKRQKELVAVEEEYKKYVESNKKSSKKFIDNSKKQIEEVRKNNPKELDKSYIKRYNLILECIEESTANKETTCDTL